MRLLLLLFFLALYGKFFAQLNEKQVAALRTEIMGMVNNLRKEKGLSPLAFSDTLREAAQKHSEYMVRKHTLTHDENISKSRTPEKRVKLAGGKNFTFIGENVVQSAPVAIPIKKDALHTLATELFEAWKNSPPHYANMVRNEYTFGDFGFAYDERSRCIYGTQVFGRHGCTVPQPIAPDNSFGIREMPANTPDPFERDRYILNNFGNFISWDNDTIRYAYHNRQLFQQIISGELDGFAIDLVSRDQFLCGAPSCLDMSPVYDGILLKPVYSRELLQLNSAKSPYRIITVAGIPPEGYYGDEFSPTLLILKNNKIYKRVFPVYAPSAPYELRPFAPHLHKGNIAMKNSGVVQTYSVYYDFSRGIPSAESLQELPEPEGEIYSVQIQSFTSIDGSEESNRKLHNQRAEFIRQHVQKELKTDAARFKTEAKENWDEMIFQFHRRSYENLAALPHDSIRYMANNRINDDIPWDSLLHEQRRSAAHIHYWGKWSPENDLDPLPAMNLRTAAVTKDPALANAALYEIYPIDTELFLVLSEPIVQEFAMTEPRCVENFSAVLSKNYWYLLPFSTRFIHYWLQHTDQLNNQARINLLHLYTLVGSELLTVWDLEAERLSNVIHPHKINPLLPPQLSDELMLNLQITYVYYFGQINDYPEIEKAFNYIEPYFRERVLSPQDENDLALFYNDWTRYDLSIELLNKSRKDRRLNQDGLFILMMTACLADGLKDNNEYLQVHQAAIKSNRVMWCEYINTYFQLLRNDSIKELFCTQCAEFN